jgi:hypothetical protein
MLPTGLLQDDFIAGQAFELFERIEVNPEKLRQFYPPTSTPRGQPISIGCLG